MGLSIIAPGKDLTGNDELTQSLALFFLTPKGSICLHPQQGFGIFDYVDQNVNVILKLIRAARTGIELWDNRINVLKVVPIFTTGKLVMSVTWSPKTDITNIINTQFNT